MRKRLSSALVLLFAWVLPQIVLAATSGQLANGRQQFINAAGAPLASGVVYVYQPNTTTPVTTYQDSNLTTANTSPIILDSNGMASIWVAPGNYREVVQDSLGNVLFDQTTSAVGTAAASLNPGATIGTSGDVTCTATQFTGASNITLPCTIAAGAVSLSKFANFNANSILGNNTGSAAAPVYLTGAQATALLSAFGGDGSGNTKGLVPAPASGDLRKVLTGAGSFQPVGVCAFVQFTWNGTSVVTGDAYNATVSRAGVGLYDIAFTSALPNANYAVAGMVQRPNTNDGLFASINYAVTPTTTGFRLGIVASSNAAATDPAAASAVVYCA